MVNDGVRATTPAEERTFDVLVRTNRAVRLVVRGVDRRAAMFVAQLKAARLGFPAYIRDHKTLALVLTVDPREPAGPRRTSS